MTLSTLGSFTLGEINVGLFAALGFLNPLVAQLDLFITGQFGLGPFLVDIQVQFNAAISAVAQLGLVVSNPFVAIQALITAFAQLQAALAAAISFGLPTAQLQISAQIAAVASLIGSLTAKLGGIKALLAAGIRLKIPAIQFIAELSANLSAGPVQLLSFTGGTLTATGGELSAAFGAGLPAPDGINPGDLVSGVVLVTKDPAAFAALQAIIKTS